PTVAITSTYDALTLPPKTMAAKTASDEPGRIVAEVTLLTNNPHKLNVSISTAKPQYVSIRKRFNL
ncbi:MAG: hypothetical protein VW583_08745, partial [Betaproteobacteria bacterium]